MAFKTTVEKSGSGNPVDDVGDRLSFGATAEPAEDVRVAIASFTGVELLVSLNDFNLKLKKLSFGSLFINSIFVSSSKFRQNFSS